MGPHEKKHLAALKRIFEDAFNLSTDKLKLKHIDKLSAARNHMREVVVTIPIEVVREIFYRQQPKIMHRDLSVLLYESMDDTYLSVLHVTVESVFDFINCGKDGYSIIENDI